MRNQQGITLGGMILFLMLMILAFYAASRIVPTYADYWLVGRALDTVLAQPNIQSSSDEGIREQFDKQLHFNNVTAATRSDLLIEHVPMGLHLSVTISAKRPFIGPVSFCMDFVAEAGAAGSAQ
jgi:hypothetical protein